MNLPSADALFCTACGTPLVEQVVDHRTRRVCPTCGQIHWRNAKPCAGALVIRNGKVLLIRRIIEPFKDYWDIPGGFCEVDEHPAETAVREVREETGLEIELTGLLGLWLDEYVARPTLNIYYLARPLTWRLRIGDDAGAAAWFAPDALPQQIAFVNGRTALEAWASRDSTPIHQRGTKKWEKFVPQALLGVCGPPRAGTRGTLRSRGDLPTIGEEWDGNQSGGCGR